MNEYVKEIVIEFENEYIIKAEFFEQYIELRKNKFDPVKLMI